MHLACMLSVCECMIQQSPLLQIQANELIAPMPSIAQPVIMLGHYKAFVRQNANLINAIEGGLSSLTWLLPDRFSDSELRLEAINSVLGLLSLVHESILEEEPHSMGKQWGLACAIASCNLTGNNSNQPYQPRWHRPGTGLQRLCDAG